MDENEVILTEKDIKLMRTARAGKIFFTITILGYFALLILDIILVYHMFEGLLYLLLGILVVLFGGDVSEIVDSIASEVFPFGIAVLCVAAVTFLSAITSIVLLCLSKKKKHFVRKIIFLVLVLCFAVATLIVSIRIIAFAV